MFSDIWCHRKSLTRELMVIVDIIRSLYYTLDFKSFKFCIHELDGKINQLYLKQCLTSLLLIYSGMDFHVDAKINLKIPCIISKYECFYYDCTFSGTETLFIIYYNISCTPLSYLHQIPDVVSEPYMGRMQIHNT